MSNSFEGILARFTPATAEQVYGELYQFCASDDMDEAAALTAFESLLQWFETERSPLAKSYGLLILGGLIDSSKLQNAQALPTICSLFAGQARLVDDYRVLDEADRFVHFVSHFAYLAGSCCEQFGDVENELSGIVVALLELFLAAPQAYWCGEGLLVARVMLEATLSDVVFAQLLDGLCPEPVMQNADQWEDAAVKTWQVATVRENHKRQLVMALQGLNLRLKEKSNSVFAPLLAEILETSFG